MIDVPDAGGDGAHPEPPAVLEVRPRLQPDLPPPGGRRRLRRLQGAPGARADDTPEAVRGAAAGLRREDEPILELFRRKELVVDRRRRPDAPKRSSNRSAAGSASRSALREGRRRACRPYPAARGRGHDLLRLAEDRGRGGPRLFRLSA